MQYIEQLLELQVYRTDKLDITLSIYIVLVVFLNI